MDLYMYPKVIPQEIPTDMHVIIDKNCHTKNNSCKHECISITNILICVIYNYAFLSFSQVHKNNLKINMSKYSLLQFFKHSAVCPVKLTIKKILTLLFKVPLYLQSLSSCSSDPTHMNMSMDGKCIVHYESLM